MTTITVSSWDVSWGDEKLMHHFDVPTFADGKSVICRLTDEAVRDLLAFGVKPVALDIDNPDFTFPDSYLDVSTSTESDGFYEVCLQFKLPGDEMHFARLVRAEVADVS